jgi:hypothetical protein
VCEEHLSIQARVDRDKTSIAVSHNLTQQQQQAMAAAVSGTNNLKRSVNTHRTKPAVTYSQPALAYSHSPAVCNGVDIVNMKCTSETGQQQYSNIVIYNIVIYNII